MAPQSSWYWRYRRETKQHTNSISGKQLTLTNQLHGNCPTLQLEVLLGKDHVSSEQATYARYCMILWSVHCTKHDGLELFTFPHKITNHLSNPPPIGVEGTDGAVNAPEEAAGLWGLL
jgi:hypothetical protein